MITIAAQEKLADGDTLTARLPALAAAGLTAVELRGKGLGEPRVVAGQLDAAGLRASAICMGYRGALLSPDAGTRRTAVDDLRRLLDAAEVLGAAGVVVVLATDPYTLAPMRPLAAAERERLIGYARHGLATLDRHCAGMRASVLLEPRNRYETVIVRTLAEGVALLREIGGTSVRLLADTFHLNIEEAGIPAALTAHISDIGYVQLADNNRELPGHGSLDFASIFDALHRTGYQGFASLEGWDLGPRHTATELTDSVARLRRYAAGAVRHEQEV